MKAGYCRDFRDMTKETCKCGVSYLSIRNESGKTLSEKYPCFGKNTDGCIYYNGYTQEEVDEHNKQYSEVIERIKAGKSPCCNASIDESKVIADGAYKGHGPRFCSKCKKIAYLV